MFLRLDTGCRSTFKMKRHLMSSGESVKNQSFLSLPLILSLSLHIRSHSFTLPLSYHFLSNSISQTFYHFLSVVLSLCLSLSFENPPSNTTLSYFLYWIIIFEVRHYFFLLPFAFLNFFLFLSEKIIFDYRFSRSCWNKF